MTPEIERSLLDAARRLRVTSYWVGGPVRDRLLQRACHDWDIVTPHAHPLAKAVARRLHAKLITLDEHYRIYRLILPPTQALPLEGGGSKGGGEVFTLDFAEMQGKTIEQDLARRDFTINAMAMPLDATEIIDPFQGQRDLKKRIVRAVSRKAFEEDPIRLLRAYRFSAQFKFKIDAQTTRWISKDSHRLTAGGENGVARERVREELLRLLSQDQAGETLSRMDQTGLLSAIFPDVEAGRRVAVRYYGKGGVVKHLLHSVLNVEWILADILQTTKNLSQKPLPPRWGKVGMGVPVSAAPLGRDSPGFTMMGGRDVKTDPPPQPSPTRREGVFGDNEIRNHLRAYLRVSLGGFPRLTYLKLAALLHDIGKPATAQMIRGRLRFFGHEEVGAKMALRILQQLRFSRQESQGVQAWVRHHMRLGNLAAANRVTDKAMARFFRDLGEEGIGMLIVSLGDHYDYLARSQWGKGKDPVEKTADALLSRYYLQRDSVIPPKMINGHELMKTLRLKPGPLIGRLLEAIQDAQAEGKVRTKEEAIRHARKVLKKGLRTQD